MPEFPIKLPAVLFLEEDGLVLEFSQGEPDRERFPEVESLGVPVVSIRATKAGLTVSEASFYLYGDRSGSFEEIWVVPGQRRKGVATAVYDAVAGLGVAVAPSRELDEDGHLFWQARLAAGSNAAARRP